jgi:hypothetical protein
MQPVKILPHKSMVMWYLLITTEVGTHNGSRKHKDIPSTNRLYILLLWKGHSIFVSEIALLEDNPVPI